VRDVRFEHIKGSSEDRGLSEDKADERTARRVNQQQREASETKQR
jgi:hypothetical protein